MAREGDVDPTGRLQQPQDELAVPLQRFAATQRRQAGADLNTRPPAPRMDPASKKLFYDYAPRPLARLLGSPLAPTGKYASGPQAERRITGGWGDSRPSGYDLGAPRTFHKGLDFAAPFGESVLASGDGVIKFVGAQSKSSGVLIVGANADTHGNVYDGDGKLVLASGEVGFGGIFIYLVHADDDFQGYRTEYFHLSRVNVKYGQKVSEGDVIGFVGKTGVAGIGPHLHYQVAYVAGKVSALVNPTALVPNYWPGHTDSTNSEASKGLPMPSTAPVAVHVAAGVSANLINGVYRSVTMQNQDLVQVRQQMAAHAERVAQVANVHETALYAAAAASQGAPPIVDSPMSFDFATGSWSDGKVV
jgi:murein DD-endopeptidase MepM/ murein hydrolase activator NlpD